MSADTQLKILNLYKGKSIKQADRALRLMQLHTANKQTSLRVKLVGLTLGD